MSGLVVEYVRQTSLEPGLLTRHVRFRGLNPDKAEKPDMSGLRVGHV
jgi:hypothetical protein